MKGNVSTAVQDVSLKMSNAETKISDICHAYNDMINGFTDHDAVIQRINTKLADLEDQSCCNNIRFQDILAKVTQPLLHDLLRHLRMASQ